MSFFVVNRCFSVEFFPVQEYNSPVPGELYKNKELKQCVRKTT